MSICSLIAILQNELINIHLQQQTTFTTTTTKSLNEGKVEVFPQEEEEDKRKVSNR